MGNEVRGGRGVRIYYESVVEGEGVLVTARVYRARHVIGEGRREDRRDIL